MEKNKTVWMFLTALVISLVIVGGSMTLSVRHQKSAVQGVTTSQPPTDPGYLMRIADGKVGLYRIGTFAQLCFRHKLGYSQKYSQLP